MTEGRIDMLPWHTLARYPTNLVESEENPHDPLHFATNAARLARSRLADDREPQRDRGAQTLEALKKAGEVKVGCEAAYVPFTYRDNTGKIVGFDVDFATKMFEPIGVKPMFIDAAMVRHHPGAPGRPLRYGPDHELHQGAAGARAVQHSLCGRLAGAADPRQPTRTRSRRSPTCRARCSATSSARPARR